jgi:SH3-like domain-containing protein
VIFVKKILCIFVHLSLLCVLSHHNALAQEVYNQKKTDNIITGRVTNFPLPRFVTLRNDKTYMRSGPGKDYALLWVYQKKGLPIEIIDEYDQWRRVKDLDGSEGWIHQSVLSGRRMVITLEGTHNVYADSDLDSDIVAKIDGGTVISPQKCTKYYCFVTHPEFSGWLEKSVLYGVYDHEKLSE